MQKCAKRQFFTEIFELEIVLVRSFHFRDEETKTEGSQRFGQTETHVFTPTSGILALLHCASSCSRQNYYFPPKRLVVFEHLRTPTDAFCDPLMEVRILPSPGCVP